MSEFTSRGFSDLSIFAPYRSAPEHRLLDEFGYERLQRLFDLIICLVALPFVLFLLGVCALSIQLESPGPVFLSQQWSGRGGRKFKSLVLRTIRVDAGMLRLQPARTDPEGASELIGGDPMVTRIGRILQETHLDELPQVLNVLRGDMALVGPRPTRPDSGILPLWHTARLEVKPGITGPWRISDVSELGSDECSRLDITYIQNRTIALDSMILLRTLGIIVSGGRWVVKRAFDVAASSMLLLVFAPLMLVIATAIRWTSPGPILFRQVRLGKDARGFRILKFRTMRVDAEAVLTADPALYAAYVANDFKLPPESDPRITPLGRWLRRTSLDELPQLINVLRGEMSMVGPRPIVPDEVVHYGHWAGKFCSVLPGLTGAWQVLGRSDLHYPERCHVELNYVRTWSLLQDMVILARTVGAVISGRGAT